MSDDANELIDIKRRKDINAFIKKRTNLFSLLSEGYNNKLRERGRQRQKVTTN